MKKIALIIAVVLVVALAVIFVWPKPTAAIDFVAQDATITTDDGTISAITSQLTNVQVSWSGLDSLGNASVNVYFGPAVEQLKKVIGTMLPGEWVWVMANTSGSLSLPNSPPIPITDPTWFEGGVAPFSLSDFFATTDGGTKQVTVYIKVEFAVDGATLVSKTDSFTVTVNNLAQTGDIGGTLITTLIP
ncbi:MAG: hypothetical protein DRI26_06620 [Chloroflexi bacterium]|nr:MAG: hypothetical protein DRI26_06620 [Chloroflexota bacterium]